MEEDWRSETSLRHARFRLLPKEETSLVVVVLENNSSEETGFIPRSSAESWRCHYHFGRVKNRCILVNYSETRKGGRKKQAKVSFCVCMSFYGHCLSGQVSLFPILCNFSPFFEKKAKAISSRFFAAFLREFSSFSELRSSSKARK